MFRRWLIRGSFIGLLLLLLAGWGVSTCRIVEGGYSHDKNTVVCGISYGALYFQWVRGWDGYGGVYTRYAPQPFRVVDRDFFWQHYSIPYLDGTEWRLWCMGFGYYHNPHGSLSGPPIEVRQVTIPCWFLIVVTGAVLWYAWTKTGRRRVARAFPVQAAGGDGATMKAQG